MPKSFIEMGDEERETYLIAYRNWLWDTLEPLVRTASSDLNSRLALAGYAWAKWSDTWKEAGFEPGRSGGQQLQKAIEESLSVNWLRESIPNLPGMLGAVEEPRAPLERDPLSSKAIAEVFARWAAPVEMVHGHFRNEAQERLKAVPGPRALRDLVGQNSNGKGQADARRTLLGQFTTRKAADAALRSPRHPEIIDAWLAAAYPRVVTSIRAVQDKEGRATSTAVLTETANYLDDIESAFPRLREIHTPTLEDYRKHVDDARKSLGSIEDVLVAWKTARRDELDIQRRELDQETADIEADGAGTPRKPLPKHYLSQATALGQLLTPHMKEISALAGKTGAWGDDLRLYSVEEVVAAIMTEVFTSLQSAAEGRARRSELSQLIGTKIKDLKAERTGMSTGKDALARKGNVNLGTEDPDGLGLPIDRSVGHGESDDDAVSGKRLELVARISQISDLNLRRMVDAAVNRALADLQEREAPLKWSAYARQASSDCLPASVHPKERARLINECAAWISALDQNRGNGDPP